MQQVVNRAKAERADFELYQARLPQRPLQRALAARPAGQHKADLSVLVVGEPARGEQQQLSRRGIQPLHVINRNQQRVLVRQ
jgi:hypothetical protein